MKSLTFLTFLTASVILTAAFHFPTSEKGEVLFTCNVNACEKVDSIFLFEFNGVTFKKAKGAPTTDWQTYQFVMPATGPRFYYVGLGNNNLRPVILGTENKVTLQGSCPSFQGAQLPDSDLNKNYETLKNKLNEFKNELSTHLRQLQAADSQNNTDLANLIIGKLADLDKKRLNLVDSLKKVSPYLAKVAALNTYLSYQNHGTGSDTEVEYFAKNYFRLADWKDPDYNYMPWVYESLKDYTTVLASVNMPDANQKDFLDRLLQQIPENSRTYMLALGGAIAGLQSKKSPLLAVYVKRYVDKYQKTEPEAVALVQQYLKVPAGSAVGGEAPDFTMNTPDGQPLSLKSFRGKVLLVDFWASWCGPCRRENPHVVEAYHKYHPKGFDVLGVSLDKSRDPWLAAIEKDGLVWNHVSDLKGWQNSAAQLYGVTSIPHTVLLDKEGKIIARNLRGPALDAKLKEIFGE
jgi:thiol-disulfide isomerase/thioredoxin